MPLPPEHVVTQGLAPDTCARLLTLLRNLASRSPARRAVLAVQGVDNPIDWAGAVGAADGEGTELRIGTPFFIASIDKLFNAALALKLTEQGRLDLDARLPEYLAPSLVRGLHCLRGVDHSAHITVRQLLGHTSGLADWLEDHPKGRRSLVDEVLQHGDRRIDLEEAVDHVRSLRPHHPPGLHRLRYSDTNYLLLTAVIEAATGQPLHTLHARHFWQPLGLRETWMAAGASPATLPPALLCARGQTLHLPLLVQSLHGIYSTVGDLMMFARALFSGQVFEHAHTLAIMQTTWRRFRPPLDRAALRAPSWPIEYGLGMMRFRLPRLFAPWHPMPAVLGHTGSTGCWLFYCPQRRLLLSGDLGEVTAGALPFGAIPRLLNVLDGVARG